MVDKNIYIIQGEINIVVGAIKRNARWSTHTPLVSGECAESLVTNLCMVKTVISFLVIIRIVGNQSCS